MIVSYEAAKQFAKTLKTEAAHHGASLKLSQCQEIISRSLGYKDFHHLQRVIGSDHLPTEQDGEVRLFVELQHEVRDAEARMAIVRSVFSLSL